MDYDLNKVTAFSFHVPGNDPFKFPGSRKNTLEDVKPINIFTGANNSGKSRLLRNVFSYLIWGHDESSPITPKAIKAIQDCKTKNKDHIQDIIHEQLKKTFSDEETVILDSNLKEVIYKIIDNSLVGHTGESNHEDIHVRAHNLFGLELWRDICSIELNLNNSLNTVRKEYLPILRGLRTLDNNRDVYLDRTIEDYFDEYKSTDKLQIFTGQSLFDDMSYAILGDEHQQESVEKYHHYLSEHFFEGQRVKITPRKTRNQVKGLKPVIEVKIGNNKQMPIFMLGDGIQAIIAMTVRPFLESSPTIFFIEEPEHNLHAGMQRSLIEAFRACPQHMFFVTSHSNDLIDIAQESDDISVYRVQQDHEEKSVVTSLNNYSLALADLGVRASSVMLANCSIWVEGVTDKLYIRALLHKFLECLEIIYKPPHEGVISTLRSMQENLHYVFTEYQGANITHWDFNEEQELHDETTFARALNRNICLIADKDIEDRSDRVEVLEKALGKKFHLLTKKEIENCIPMDAVLAAAQARLEGSRTNPDTKFNKDDIVESEYRDSDGIGSYLESLVVNPALGNITKKMKQGKTPEQIAQLIAPPLKYFEGDSGTISNKVDFCKSAVKHINNTRAKDIKWNKETVQLCYFVFEHILECNSSKYRLDNLDTILGKIVPPKTSMLPKELEASTQKAPN